MRRNLLVALALSAALAIGVTAIASATSVTVRTGNLILTFGGSVSPKAMPKKNYVPVTTNIFGKIKTSDGTHPSALREVLVNIDKDVKINAKGFPTCSTAKLNAQNSTAARKVCGKAILGKGISHVEIAFAEQKPILVPSPLTVFNGGESGGKVKLLIHIFITVPVPAAVVTEVTIKRSGTGIKSVAKVPRVAGGAGSAIDFSFKLEPKKNGKKSFFEARCPDGKFKTSTPKALFRNEANTPGVPAQTVLKGNLAVPCTPKG